LKDLTDTDIELLSRYIDGELEADASRELERRLKAESALQSALVRMEELNQRLRDALTERATIPESITERLRQAATQGGTGQVLPFPGERARARDSRRVPWQAALAASLVAAVALGLLVGTPDPQRQGLPGNDARVAKALDSQPSGSGWAALGDGRELQPVLTFPHRDGHWCREFLLRGGENDWRAVACRVDGVWVTQAAGLESFLDADNAYRPAGASDAAPVAVFIDQNAADIALGRDDEAALLADWGGDAG
jgi:hypothetical protein